MAYISQIEAKTQIRLEALPLMFSVYLLEIPNSAKKESAAFLTMGAQSLSSTESTTVR